MAMNSVGNLPANLIGRALTQNFSAEDKDRRDEMDLNKDYYYDKQEQTISLYNDDQTPYVLNILKPIVRKRASLLYSHAPNRIFDGPSQSAAFLEAVYEENNINQLMLQADLYSELTGSALITPVVNEEWDNGIQLRMYDGSSCTALASEDDPQELDALSIVKQVDRIVNSNLDVERVLKQQIWTKETVFEYEGNVLMGSETNELGFIPFANIKGEEVYDQYFGHAPARGLRLLNQSLNALITDFAYVIKFQGFTPVAISGMSGDSRISIHPGRALCLPAGAAAMTLNTNPKLSDTLAFIAWLEEKAYESTGVPKIAVVGGGEAKSGRELMVRWFPLLQVFQEKSTRFQVYELELANTILAVVGLPLLNAVKVEYVKDAILPLLAEDDDLLQDIQFNIKTPADELMRRKAELSIEEAEQIILANKEFNDSLKSASVSEEDPNGEKVDNQEPDASVIEDEEEVAPGEQSEQESTEEL
jgi:hypothetical protein